MADVAEQIEVISKQAAAELAGIADVAALEQFRIKFLGAKGAIKGLMTLLGQVPKDQKPAVGQKINAVKDRVTSAYEAKKSELAAGGSTQDWLDVTEPGARPSHRKSPHPQQSDQRTHRTLRPHGFLHRLRPGSRG